MITALARRMFLCIAMVSLPGNLAVTEMQFEFRLEFERRARQKFSDWRSVWLKAAPGEGCGGTWRGGLVACAGRLGKTKGRGG
ncbi:MAG TPA: hypothetical protein DIC61_00825 [Pseudomonas sp.]|nr:hypothetical protein [Pseudomonas sp.]